MLLQSYPFLLCCLIVHSIVLLFCISVVSVVFLFFDFFIWIFSLFIFMSLARGLSILFTLSKNQLLVSLIFFFSSFLNLSLFIPSLIFITSFLLLTLGFVCSSFSSSFRWRIRWFISTFFFSLKKAYIIMNFPLRSCFTDFNVQWLYQGNITVQTR